MKLKESHFLHEFCSDIQSGDRSTEPDNVDETVYVRIFWKLIRNDWTFLSSFWIFH